MNAFRKRGTVSEYNRLPIAQKRAEDLARVRDPAVTCQICDTQVMPVDLLAHLEQRCPGPRDPGPGSRWIAHGEALALGVPRVTLKRWADRGRVRFKGERGDRQYLYRDLALTMAQQRLNRRR